MPYSKPLGLIFVAIPKTGTTSVTRAMGKMAKPYGELELLREKIDKKYRKKYHLNEIGDRKPGRGKHLSAIQIKYILGDEEFERCTKFSVVRNSWARMASRYYFTHVNSEPSDEDKVRRGTTRTFHNMEFEPWLDRILLRQKIGRRRNSQVAKLTDLNGELLVDHVGRLDEVQSTLDWVTNKVGIESVTMPHVNGTRKGHYSRFYNETTKEIVAEICREDIEFFKFEFEEEKEA